MDAKKMIGAAIGVAIAGYEVYRIGTEKTQKYSSRWFDTVSDAVLNEEREVVRKKYCFSGNDFDLAVRLEKLLHRFDSVLSKRAWNESTDYKFPVRSEHGWYLPSDD